MELVMTNRLEILFIVIHRIDSFEDEKKNPTELTQDYRIEYNAKCPSITNSSKNEDSNLKIIFDMKNEELIRFICKKIVFHYINQVRVILTDYLEMK